MQVPKGYAFPFSVLNAYRLPDCIFISHSDKGNEYICFLGSYIPMIIVLNIVYIMSI